MRFHHLDLNLLVALDTILTERNVTHSAQKLNISQSAASGLLSRLRDYFDDELLVQSGRQMLPTPLAVSLQEPLKRVLLDIKTNIVGDKHFDPLESNRHFKIMASDYVTTVFLSPLFNHVHRLAPNMTFDIIPNNNQYNDAIARGDIDFLIQPNLYMKNDQPKAFLFEDSYSCVVWRDNPLVSDTINNEEYLSLGHVVINLGEMRVPSFEEDFAKKYGQDRRIEVHTSDFNTLPHLVVGTNRITVMQTRLARIHAKTLPIKIINTPEPIPSLREYMQWNRILDSDPAHEWLRSMCHQVFSPE